MSIRNLALDLYRAQQNVERLEKAVAKAAPGELAALEDELRGARAEWRMLRKMLDGEKETASFRARSAFYHRNR
jgi:hypothetical protein